MLSCPEFEQQQQQQHHHLDLINAMLDAIARNDVGAAQHAAFALLSLVHDPLVGGAIVRVDIDRAWRGGSALFRALAKAAANPAKAGGGVQLQMLERVLAPMFKDGIAPRALFDLIDLFVWSSRPVRRGGEVGGMSDDGLALLDWGLRLALNCDLISTDFLSALYGSAKRADNRSAAELLARHGVPLPLD